MTPASATDSSPPVGQGIDRSRGKGSAPCGRPAAPCQVAAVVLGGHDGCLQVLIPDARRPVANGQEVLGVEGVAH